MNFIVCYEIETSTSVPNETFESFDNLEEAQGFLEDLKWDRRVVKGTLCVMIDSIIGYNRRQK